MRVLFVTYYYPPSGGPGVQRSLKFTRFLPDFGWDPVVLTVRPEDAAYPALDSSLVREIPDTIEVHRTVAWDPYSAYATLVGKEKHETIGVGFLGESNPSWQQRLGRWLRANIFIPDARIGWVPYALRGAEHLLSEQEFDAVWTTGPPHSTHLIGQRIARGHGLPWVADFRDPWTGIDYSDLLPSTRLARKIDAALERRVLRKADAVTVVSPSMERALRALVPRTYCVIPNGYDPEDVRPGIPVDAERFHIAHVGSLNEARNPDALWEALARLNAPAAMPELRVQFVGRVDPVVLEAARRRGVDELVEHVPYLEHREAVHRMQTSALLLLVINRVAGAEGILTGKLFEYVGSGRPVLGIGPESGDASVLLHETGAGTMHAFDAVDAVARTIERHYQAWRAGRPIAGAPYEKAVSYSRRKQAEVLAQLLGSVASGRTE